MIIKEEEYLAHFGTPRHSGRYPWGSGGDNTNPRTMTFLDTVNDLRRQGLSSSEIAQGMGMTSTEFRIKTSIDKTRLKQEQISKAQDLHDRGVSNLAIGREMGIAESNVRALLAPGAKEKADVLDNIARVVKDAVDKDTYVDIGSGVEASLGISKEKLSKAVAILEEQGYKKHNVPVSQVATGFETETKVLTPPGTTQNTAWQNRLNIKQIAAYSNDGGTTFGRMDHPPISINPNRISVRYAEDGGDKTDGMIYVRPGVEDISLGNNRYAQVRVLVGESHYLKGMALYKNDLPKGTDLLFNTSKSKSNIPNKLDALKKIADDKDYPFGSVIHQLIADPGTSNERVTSAMNFVGGKRGSGEEGAWGKWNKNLSAQVLSKQNLSLARSQLDMTYEEFQKDLDEIKSLTNPTIKKKLLNTFADSADASAVHLKAAALPRSIWHVILPLETMPPTQIFAPKYNNGERVVLIRYPHGGTFEIPELTVNNRNSEGREAIGSSSQDAVGIHYSVAERLSGADFDGDTVLVIPNDKGRIETSPALEGLKNFNPKISYAPYDGMPTIDGGIYRKATNSVDYEGRIPDGGRKQAEMGKISNLITDMTILGAPNNEIVRAIRHSMVVIDSEKHSLDYKLSAQNNGISSLKKTYQGKTNAGAATLISRKKSTESVPDRKLRLQGQGGPLDEIGRKVYVETGATRRDKNGNIVPKTMRVNKLAETHDAKSLISSAGTFMETIYADHSNKLKALANDARLAASKTPLLTQSKSAKKVYSNEVDSLNAKLSLVIKNRPLERQAQILAGASIKAKRLANPNLDGDSLKKIKFQEQEKARQRTGAKSREIQISSKEWDAIQAGAVSDNVLSQILDKADLEIVRKFATPRREVLMTLAKTQRAQEMLASGYTRAEIAAHLGVSLTSLDNATNI